MVSSTWPDHLTRPGAGKGMDLYDGAGVNQFLLSGLAADVTALHCAVTRVRCDAVRIGSLSQRG